MESSTRSLLILTCLPFFGLQIMFAFPDEQFRPWNEEQFPTLPDEQLSTFPDKQLLENSDGQLQAGSDCESAFCANPLDLLNNVGNGLRNLWPFGNAEPPNLLIPPETQPNPGKNPGDIPDVPPKVDPQIEILQVAPNSDTQRCKPIGAPDDPDSANQQGDADTRGCEKATQRLVFPRSCAEVSQNTITEGIINGMDPKFEVIRDPTCGVPNGVLFWLGWFTSEQAKTLRGGGEAVRAIVKNIKAKPDSPIKVKRNGPKQSKRSINIAENFDSEIRDTHIPEPKAEHAFGIPNTPIVQAGTLGLDKRASFPVLRREVDDPSLNHLSTAPDRSIKSYYTFFREAGQGVLVIVLETAFPEVFSNIDPARVRNGDSDFLHSPTTPDDQVLGECTVDKIGGELYGVATNTQFALFEVSPDLASFLPALAAIARKVRDGQIVPLSNGMVMNVRMSFQPEEMEEQELADIMAERISALLTAGIIFVTSAGASGDEKAVTTYPSKLSTRLPIITVGVVAPYTGISNGPRGREVTVYSVILGQCSPILYGHRYSRGAGIALATVTGLAAYFLSLPDLHARFGPPGLDRSRKLIEYLQLMSYRREPVSPGSVWNGHDNEDASVWYGNGPLNPPTRSN